MKHLTLTATLLLVLGACAPKQEQVQEKAKTEAGRLTATVYNSQFPQGHDTYNGMGTASDGRIYYVLSSEHYDIAGRM